MRVGTQEGVLTEVVPVGATLGRRRENDADLRPATAARDRSPPGFNRSALPRTDGPLLADSLEGVRSVGAVKLMLFTAGDGPAGPQPSRLQPILPPSNRSSLARPSPERLPL